MGNASTPACLPLSPPSSLESKEAVFTQPPHNLHTFTILLFFEKPIILTYSTIIFIVKIVIQTTMPEPSSFCKRNHDSLQRPI